MIAETICAAASVAGLGVAGITAYRKRFLAAARIAAYALVPLGLVLTGAVQWVVDTAFSPTAWIGFGLLGGAWALFMTVRAVERRSGVGRKDRKAAAKAARREAVAPAASAPSLGRGARGAAEPAARPKASGSGSGAGEDFSDIEAILKKHGI
ncbi:hypothetical protein GCM10010387_64910 [Streptomyces inusitatus]|uniref:Uncharacterized protein n=1 Tax=Streptomyces inusitatus TaxID=68221 RepID=A0A918QPT4_9ACTN|nr:hypothetical protein [Streptomyces inusitatus]GGZ62497.1 hypothetical protein GCM10010387_64910 [Streptomyces inusitatus]